MSMLNIAIIAGIALCLVVLLIQRRKDSGDTSASGAGRGRGDRKRRRGKKGGTPPPPPEPMPLAAAGQSSAPVSPPMAGPAPEPAPPAPEPSVAEWPPAEDPAPPEWAPPAQEAPAAPEPAPQVAHVPADEMEVEAGWPSDEIVTEPGWPIPGEVDVPWTAAAEPVGAGVGGETSQSWSEQAATAAPPDLQWAAPEQIVEEAPQWAPVEDSVPGDIPQWSPPEQVVEAAPAPPDAWEPPADEWTTQEPVPAEDAQATGEIPVVREPEAVVAEAPPAAEPVADPAFEAAFEAPEDVLRAVEPEADEQPATPLDFAAFEQEEAPVFAEEEAPVFAEETPVFAEEEQAPVFAQDEVPSFAQEEVPAFDDFPPPPEQPVAQEPDEIPSWDAPVAEAPVEAPAPVPVAAAPVAAAVPVAAPVVDDAARTGRFAIGGFAIQPGQQALGGVSFRSELAQAPTAWTVSDSDDVAPGTLVLQLDGTINCEAAGLEVVTEPGFAPTPLGFTVRVSALASGPFAASGTFRIR